MYDTPGIMVPKVKNTEVGFNLGLAGCIPDYIIKEEDLCDYILFRLNQLNIYKYVKILKLNEPVDDITYLLNKISMNEKCNTNIAARKFLNRFRKGEYGRYMFDDIPEI